jgi:hypothetical protein
LNSHAKLRDGVNHADAGRRESAGRLIPFPELIESKYYGIEAPIAGVNCI